MTVGTGKSIVIRPEQRQSDRIFEAVLDIIAYLAIYSVVVSALPFAPAYYAVLPIGVAATTALVLFFDKKRVRYGVLGAIALFTLLAVSAGYIAFRNGMLGFFNAALTKVNASRHWGISSFVADESFGATFLFMCVFTLWHAVLSAYAVRKMYIYLCISAALTFLFLALGLYPHYAVIMLLAAVYVCLLAAYNGFSLKASWCYLVTAIVALAAISPCCLYGGSTAVSGFSHSVKAAVEDVFYGNSLPGGRLADSYGMRSSDKVRLRLVVPASASTLYLKGFVGSEFDGDCWTATDKNRYVENGYQGILDYVSDIGLPAKQYAAYSALNSRESRYELSVENVSADRRYVYAPYTLAEYSTGKPYYDLGLHGGVLTKKKYTHTIFAADASSERVTQAQWVTSAPDRSVAMNDYIEIESQYRAFVYDSYVGLDENTASAVMSAVGDLSTDSINTAAQFIRAYFEENFVYADRCDPTRDFATEFFGGEIRNANAAYFASAATLMFRALGFAARYAEGYYVNIEVPDGEESVTAEITGDGTHAWTEVYFDGIGWLPIEVTPTFYSESEPDVTVDPDDPDSTSPEHTNPTPPAKDPDDPDKPDLPDRPDIPDIPDPPVQNTENMRLLAALKVLLPIVAVLFAIGAAVLAAGIRYHRVLDKRRKKLDCDGEDFGRAAYDTVSGICKRFGGFDRDNLSRYGVSADTTDRFIRIAERCVYGGHALRPNERKFMLLYIETVQKALTANCGFVRALYYKYILCVGA